MPVTPVIGRRLPTIPKVAVAPSNEHFEPSVAIHCQNWQTDRNMLGGAVQVMASPPAPSGTQASGFLPPVYRVG